MKLKILTGFKIRDGFDFKPVPVCANGYENIDCPDKLPEDLVRSAVSRRQWERLNLFTEKCIVDIYLQDGRAFSLITSPGLVNDDASVPGIFTPIAKPSDPKVKLAAFVHDCLYYEEVVWMGKSFLTFSEVQLVFRDVMILRGASRLWAAKYWITTRLFSRGLYRRDNLLDKLMSPFVEYEIIQEKTNTMM